MLKIKELFKKQYDLLKEEYEKISNELPILIEKEKNEEKRLKENGYGYSDIRFNMENCAFILNGIRSDIKNVKVQKQILFKKLNKINEILNNNEHIISLKRTELDEFSKGKIILEVGTSAIGNSKAKIKGNLSGEIGGSSFLGFGNIDGSISGSLNGTSNAHYEEYILVKYKYNLDYEIEEFLFNIDDYLVEKVEDKGE